MNRYMAISEASEVLGVSITTLLQCQERLQGKLISQHTAVHQRRLDGVKQAVVAASC